MSEQSVASARAKVMYYDTTQKKWLTTGSTLTNNDISKVQIFHNEEKDTFRVVGRKVENKEVVMNRNIIKGLKYFQATPLFHQWRDSSQIHGLSFATREDAETFALAMERVLDILSHNSMYLTNRASQPMYQTIGHSGVSLDDCMDIREWENDGNFETSLAVRPELLKYQSVQPRNSIYKAFTPDNIPKWPQSIAPPQQVASTPSPSTVPPPPPPPPPNNCAYSAPITSGMATLPRLHPKMDDSEPMTESSFQAALASAKLKKTTPKSAESPANDVKPTIMASMMDEMSKTLARRRAQTDSCLVSENASDKAWNKNSGNGSSPSRNGGSPVSLRRSESDDGKGQIVLNVGDIAKVKQEIISEMKTELAKFKRELIDVVKLEINKALNYR